MKIKGKDYINGKLVYEGEYIYDDGIYKNVKYNGKSYDETSCLLYVIFNGNGKVREYYHDGTLLFEGEYKNGRRNGKEKNLIIKVIMNMKENLQKKKNKLVKKLLIYEVNKYKC